MAFTGGAETFVERGARHFLIELLATVADDPDFEGSHCVLHSI